MKPEPSLVGPLRLLGVGAAVVAVNLLVWWWAANTLPGPFEEGGDDALFWVGLMLLMLLASIVATASALIWLCVNFVRRLM